MLCSVTYLLLTINNIFLNSIIIARILENNGNINTFGIVVVITVYVTHSIRFLSYIILVSEVAVTSVL